MTGKGNAAKSVPANYERSKPTRRRQSPRGNPPSWSQFPPSVLGSLVIRLGELGYGVLFGSTSDKGRLTLSLYSNGVRESLYYGKGVTVKQLLSDVGSIVGADIPPPEPPKALISPPADNLGYLAWMRLMKMSEKQIEASCKANGRLYVPP